MADQNSFVKLTRSFMPHLHLIRRGSTAVVWLWCVLNQDEQGIVDADLDDIMTVTQLGKATIVSAIDNLEAASLIQPVQPRQKGQGSYRLSGDFSRFGAGAPTGNGGFGIPIVDASPKKVFLPLSSPVHGSKKVFSAPGSSSDSESLTDPGNQEKQLQLPLPTRAEKTFVRSSPNVFALYEQEGFGPLTPLVGEMLGDWIDTLGEERVKEAIRQAVLRNVRTLVYVQAILKKWAEEKRITENPPADFDDNESFAAEPHAQPEPLPFTDQDGQARDAGECWRIACGELKLQLPREAFDTWLMTATLKSFEHGVLTVAVTNIYAQEWLEHRLKRVIVRTAQAVFHLSMLEVCFVVEEIGR